MVKWPWDQSLIPREKVKEKEKKYFVEPIEVGMVGVLRKKTKVNKMPSWGGSNKERTLILLNSVWR